MKKIIFTFLVIIATFSGCSSIKWVHYSKDNVSIHIPEKKNSYSYYPDEQTIFNELDYQNELVKDITKKYKINLKRKIDIYFFPQEISLRMIGTTHGGSYNYDTNKIEYVLSEPSISVISQKKSLMGDHETVHVIFMSEFGCSDSRLMNEGLAVAIDKAYGITERNGSKYRVSIDEIVKYQVIKKKILSIKSLCSDKGNEELFYPQAGVFIEWLIKNYNFDKYIELYNNASDKILNETEEYLGRSISALEQEYYNYLLNY